MTILIKKFTLHFCFYQNVSDELQNIKKVLPTSTVLTNCQSRVANPLGPSEEIVILEPDGLNDVITRGDLYMLRCKNNTGKNVWIYYDKDTDGENGELITQMPSTQNYYLWDTDGLSPGRYYIFLSTSLPPVQTYKCSSGPLTILADIPQVRVYPNPFYPSKGHKQIVFGNLMKFNEIKIYNLAGELVKKAVVRDTIEWPWNVRNDTNEEVASGVYFYLFSSNTGQTSTGKVAIVR